MSTSVDGGAGSGLGVSQSLSNLVSSYSVNSLLVCTERDLNKDTLVFYVFSSLFVTPQEGCVSELLSEDFSDFPCDFSIYHAMRNIKKIKIIMGILRITNKCMG